MPDLSTGSITVGAGVAGAVQLAANFQKHFISQSDAGSEIVVSATKGGGLTEADMLAVTRQLTLGTATPPNDRNGPDAFTIAAVGTADGTDLVLSGEGQDTVAYFRIQGTGGVPNLTEVSGVTLAAVAYFRPRF